MFSAAKLTPLPLKGHIVSTLKLSCLLTEDAGDEKKKSPLSWGTWTLCTRVVMVLVVIHGSPSNPGG